MCRIDAALACCAAFRSRFERMHVASLPVDHPQRRSLADEVHSRPPAAVQAPAAVACLALVDATPADALAAVAALAARAGVAFAVSPDAPHVLLELPSLRLKWERHGEFVSLVFVRPLDADAVPNALTAWPSAFAALPPDWLAALPGRTIAAADVLLLPSAAVDAASTSASGFDGDALAGARVLDGAARVLTDFVVRPDGRTRWLVLDDAGMGAAQSARVVQRVIEIEIYRMTALLAFPLARAAFPALNRIERQLEAIGAATAAQQGIAASPASQQEERRLLDELSRVAAEVESSIASTAFRFSAAQAYWDIVCARVAEFREQRIGDLRTLHGFLMRRMAPAMNSCAAARRRQEELSARIARASDLLRTRVDVAREEQNQRLLLAMERRGKLQLRLQRTVETLSVAAVTYYGAGLVGYLAKPLTAAWPRLSPDVLTALAVPVIALVVWRVLRRIHVHFDAD